MRGVQAYLRAVAAGDRQLIATGSFDVFLDTRADHPHLNYAIPRDGAKPSEDEVDELVSVMAAAGRTPRLELLAGTAPEAEAALLARGFQIELRTRVMTCAAEDHVAIDVPESVTLRELGPDAEREEVYGLLAVLAGAFDQAFDRSSAEVEAGKMLRRTAILAFADEEPAGGALALEPREGTTEIVGVGVLEPFRRRGIGAAVTSELARLVFSRGATRAFLTPGSEANERVYARCGFQVTDEMLHLIRRN